MSDETKACPVCGEDIKAAAIKCRFCNTDLAAYSAAKEIETEKTLFTGHPAVISTSGNGWLLEQLSARRVTRAHLQPTLDNVASQLWMTIDGRAAEHSDG